MDAAIEDGRIVEVGGNEAVTGRSLLQRASQVAAVNGRHAFLGRSLSKVAERVIQVAGLRWRHWLQSIRMWFEEDFVVDMSALHAELGIDSTDLALALEDDRRRCMQLEDPNLREEGVTYRRFNATVYSPGAVSVRDLPTGPRRYDA